MPIALDPTKPILSAPAKRSIEEIRKLVVGVPQTRQFFARATAIDQDARTAEMSFSSELPVHRFWGYEILSHDPGAIRMDRAANGIPFCNNHETSDQRGRVEGFRCDADKVTRGTVRFSRTQAGQDFFTDFADGIRCETSIGYRVHSFEEIPPERMSPELKTMCLENKCGAYLADDWEPLEVSSAPVPADPSVGAGRSKSMNVDERGEKPLVQTQDQAPSTPTPSPSGGSRMEPKTTEEVLREERERVSAIDALGKRLVGRIAKIDELAAQAIAQGTSIAEFKGMIADRTADGQAVFTPESELGLSNKEQQRFSLLRLIQSQIKNSGIEAPFERECSNEIAKRTGQTPKGFLVPWDIQNRTFDVPISGPADLEKLAAIANRAGLYHAARTAMTTASATAAGNVVATLLRPDLFIDLLRNASVAGKVGVETIVGLIGNIDLPRQTAASTFSWLAQTAQTSASNLTVDKVTLTPQEGRAYQEYSRMLLLQATPSIEMLVQNDLFKVALLGIDQAVFFGAGHASQQPKGIAIESGIGSVDCSQGVSWPQVVQFETLIRTSNVQNDLKWVMRPTVKGILKTRPKTLQFPMFLMDDQNRCNGYDSVASSQITDQYLFLGDFTWEILAYWGNMDLLVNPYIKDDYAQTRVSVYVDVDSALRQAGAVAMSSNVV